MREKFDILSDNFSNIGTVVFYKHHKYIPTSLEYMDDSDNELLQASLVKYHGSKSNFPSLDFSEYDFSYIIDKYKFDNKLLISELDTESLELVGKDIKNTDKIGKILFPTLVEEEMNNSYRFFGSLNILGQDLYFFECPEDYQTIEIYDDVIDSNIVGGDGFTEYDYLKLTDNTNIIKPAIIIRLGPPADAYNNPTCFYYKKDPMISRIMRLDNVYTSLEYSRLCDEIWSKKVVSFFLSTSGEVTEFNLSFSAWEKNANPERNKWKYDLRNDEFYNILQVDQSIIGNDGTVWTDKKSGAILGNFGIDSFLCPIFSNKLDRLRRTQNIYYSPYRKYSRGESTIYKVTKPDGSIASYTVESLVNGNIGNDPLLSPAWILKDKFLDFVSSIIYISQSPASCGSIINPGTQVTVKSDSRVEFSIIDGLGYLFSGVSIINSASEIINLTEGSDYTSSLITNNEGYTKTVVIDSWNSFLDQNSPRYTDNLVFNFSKRPSIIKLLVQRGGVDYNYSSWAEAFGEEFSMVLKLNGEIIDNNTSSLGSTSVSSGDLYLFINNPETNPTLEIEFSGSLVKDEIKSNYLLGNRRYAKSIPVINNIATDTIDFSDSVYTILVESINKYLSVRSNRWINCDTTGLVTVNYGSIRVISFTIASGYKPSIDLVNFWYDENNRVVKYENDITIENYPSVSGLFLNEETTVTAELTQNEFGRFYLKLTNITENTIIQISGVKI